MSGIRYSVLINGVSHTLTYVSHSKTGYPYKDNNGNRHVFMLPLSRYELNKPITVNNNTYIIKSKP